MKYNTRPINFDDCHPVIAKALKHGEAIECEVWDGGRKHDKEKRYVTGYDDSGVYITSGVIEWDYAEPITSKTRRIMPFERAIHTLIAEGWVFDDSGDMVGCGNRVVPPMFKLMGKSLSDPKTYGWVWPACIIEEVEDDE